MEEEGKKTPRNRSFSQRKKSSRSKCKLASKRKSSSLSRRRKKKTLAKLISQNSIDNVHCFPIPFADFFCGCGKDCGKDKNKIKKISSNKLPKINKQDDSWSKKSDKPKEEKREEREGGTAAVEAEDVECPVTSVEAEDVECPVRSVDALAALAEPLDLDKLKLSSNMKHLLANVKFTSIFGCANVPKSMSQIKILLDNNPTLKSQLKHILGDNLKSENMKPVADLLASEKEESADELSNDSSIRQLSISKSVMDTKKNYTLESVNSSFIFSKHGDERSKSVDGSENHNRSLKARTKTTSRKKGSSRRSNASDSQMSLFAKIFSSVFRSNKPNKNNKEKKPSSKEADKTSRKSFRQRESSLDDEKTKEMREKYDEWYKRTPEEVRERFRWEDYVRVTMYLNDIKDASSSNDEKTKEMLNLWLRKFSKEMNRPGPSNDETAIDPDVENQDVSEENPGTKLKRIISEEMLNSGGGDVICRLNTLMKELVESAESGEEKAHGDTAGDVEENCNPDTDEPGCSKWFQDGASNAADGAGKSSTTTDEVSIYQMMCASFVDKLSKHGSKESKTVLGSRYNAEMPWQNKDFQVFYVPTIETRFTSNPLSRSNDFGCFEGLGESHLYAASKSSDESIGQKSSKTSDLESRGSSENTISEDCAKSEKDEKTSLSEQSEGKSEDKEESKCPSTKLSHQKRVSFEDAPSNGSDEEKAKDTSEEDDIQQEMNESEELDSEGRVASLGTSSAVTVCSSSNADLNFILDNSLKDESSKESRENLQYIRDHKCQLVEILKYLLTLANQDSAFFRSISNTKFDISASSKYRACVGIQCNMWEEETRSGSAYSELSVKDTAALAKFQHLLKSQSETMPRKIGSRSESVGSDSVKLVSSLSDSGVHSNSSATSQRRQFVSLPDVLEGASVVLTAVDPSQDASKQNSQDSMTKDSSVSNLLASCLSTSVSCQASQAPDVDDFSQVSTSELSDTQYKILGTRSSTMFKHDGEHASSSEKSRSSENTRSCPEIKETKATRSRIKKIFRKIGVKETKK